MRRVLGLAIVAATFMVAAATANAATSPIIKAIYGFSFSGGSAATNGGFCGDECFHLATRAAGTGAFAADGKGDILAGIVYCNQASDDSFEGGQEWVGTITGGAWEFEPGTNNGVGFMYWVFGDSNPGSQPAEQSEPTGNDNFCDSSIDTIAFTISMVQNNTQILFAATGYQNDDSDPGDDDYASPTGAHKNVSGVAYRDTALVGLPQTTFGGAQ